MGKGRWSLKYWRQDTLGNVSCPKIVLNAATEEEAVVEATDKWRDVVSIAIDESFITQEVRHPRVSYELSLELKGHKKQ